jgi:hypothetical protein
MAIRAASAGGPTTYEAMGLELASSGVAPLRPVLMQQSRSEDASRLHMVWVVAVYGPKLTNRYRRTSLSRRKSDTE